MKYDCKSYDLRDIIRRSNSYNNIKLKTKVTKSNRNVTLEFKLRDGVLELQSLYEDTVSIYFRSGKSTLMDIGRIVELEKMNDNKYMLFYISNFDDSKIRVIKFN